MSEKMLCLNKYIFFIKKKELIDFLDILDETLTDFLHYQFSPQSGPIDGNLVSGLTG